MDVIKQMKVVNAGYEILSDISAGGIKELQMIEKAGRICYKSEGKITPDGESAKKFVKKLIKSGHDAMLEHSSLSVMFRVDRGITHELVRHRIMSFAQESTRYCNYSNDKFGNSITVIKPCWLDDESSQDYIDWKQSMILAEIEYFKLISQGWSPQKARSVLPTSLKSDIVLTGNYREWRHFFKLRACSTYGVPHPQMLEVTVPLLYELSERIPVVFDDLL